MDNTVLTTKIGAGAETPFHRRTLDGILEQIWGCTACFTSNNVLQSCQALHHFAFRAPYFFFLIYKFKIPYTPMRSTISPIVDLFCQTYKAACKHISGITFKNFDMNTAKSESNSCFHTLQYLKCRVKELRFTICPCQDRAGLFG